MPTGLNRSSLGRVHPDVAIPGYDIDRVTVGIVHLGIGAFHRAHQAVYTDDVLGRASAGWGILGVSLRSPMTRDRLAAQDFLYSVTEKENEQAQSRIIGAVRGVLVAPEDPLRVIDALCDPNVKLVSLTVTEKGYCHRPATGDLDLDHADIRHDIETPGCPKTAPGFIVAALAQRRRRGAAPFTVLSCDNLTGNGGLTRRVCLQLAEHVDPALATWIGNHAAFPSSMVDRIVPAATEALRKESELRLGLRDEAPVVCEPFRQWVIEDQFANDRPPWEDAGVLLVSDVAPYEEAKLRLLNGTHSTLAYLGFLAGYETIAEVVADECFRDLALRLMREEVSPSLSILPDIDFTAYSEQILARFANTALGHRTSQIAMDGSRKLPERLLTPLRHQLATGGQIDALCLSIAAWVRYCAGRDEQGLPHEVSDPLSARFAKIVHRTGMDPGKLLEAFVSLQEVFGEDLPHAARFIATAGRWLEILLQRGAKQAATHFVARRQTGGGAI